MRTNGHNAISGPVLIPDFKLHGPFPIRLCIIVAPVPRFVRFERKTV